MGSYTYPVKYVDINTNDIKSAMFFSFNPTLDATTLKDSDGNNFVVARWQLDIKKNGKTVNNRKVIITDEHATYELVFDTNKTMDSEALHMLLAYNSPENEYTVRFTNILVDDYPIDEYPYEMPEKPLGYKY